MLFDLKASLRRHTTPSWFIALLLFATAGCQSVLTPISGIPASQVPDELLGIRRSDYAAIPVVMLARQPEETYLLDTGDIIGVYIDGILPFSSPTTVPIPPPVHYASEESNLPPSIGYPIPIQENGMINLPLLKPFSVKGMTIETARDEIANQYREKEFLPSEDTYPVISIIQKRQAVVTVIRSNAGEAIGSDGTAAGYTLRLDADRNDVLTALTQSGGLPGFNEKNEVTVFKTSQMPQHLRSEIMAQLMNHDSTNGLCGDCSQVSVDGGIPFENSSTDPYLIDAGMFNGGMIEDRWVVRIPLRAAPGQLPRIPPSDVILDDGDIVFVDSRETEFFYTGGQLQSGQHPLPRDYDLDVLGAMAIAGQGYGSTRGGGGGGGGGQVGIGSFGGASPTLLYIIRKLPCGRTFNIIVDLQIAANNSSENILVQPGDTLILRFKPHEEVVNFGIGTFFTFGISQLFNGNNNN
jgi:protein involved in polysaccharide export with SLBB domain